MIKRFVSIIKRRGIAGDPGDKQQFVERLIARGLTYDNALAQYEAELRFLRHFIFILFSICSEYENYIW